MKWIGQDIYDYVVRFRNTVIIDGVSVSAIQTSAESFSDDDTSLMTSAAIADKIEAYGYSTGDITGVVLTDDDGGTISDTAGSADFTIAGGSGITTSGSSTTMTIAGDDASTSAKGVASFSSNFFSVSSGAVSLATAMTWADTTITTDTVTLTSANTNDPVFTIQNTSNDQRGATLKFNKNRGQDAVDADTIGNIIFSGYDDGTPSTQDYGAIICTVADATSGQEAGNLDFYVPSYDGVVTKGLQLLGDTNADGEVDVTIAAGAASTTTVAGNLTVTGDITSVGDDVSIGDDLLFTSAAGKIKFEGTAGGGGEGVLYKDAGGTNRNALFFPGSDVVAVANRASNGVVEIRANTSTAGSSGEVTQVTVEDDKVKIAGSLELGHASDTTIARSSGGVVTIEGNTIVTKADYHYQYIHFLGNATVPADGDWMTVSGNGISNHTWNTNLGSGGTTVGSSTATIPVAAIGAGIRIPYAGILVGFTGITNRASNHQSAVGLLLGEPTWNDYAAFDCTLRAYHAADISAGPDSNYSSRPVKSEDLTRSQAISAGQVIYPVIKDLGSNASVCKVSMTIVIKTLIP